MNYAQYYNMRPGDRIIQGVYGTGIIKHFAVFLGYINGYEWVAENHKGSGVQIVTAEYYFSTIQDIFYVEYFAGLEQTRAEIVRRALLLQGAPYDVFSFNCEHYVNYVQYGKVRSTQVVWGIAFGVGLALLFNNKQ